MPRKSVFYPACESDLNDLRQSILSGRDGTDVAGVDRFLTKGHHQEFVDMLVNLMTRYEPCNEQPCNKQDAVVCALAFVSCAKRDDVRRAAFQAIPKILITPALQFSFLFTWRRRIRENQGLHGVGWGRGLRTAFLKIYLETPLQKLARDITCEGNRERQADVLRLIHPSVGGKRKVDGTFSDAKLDPGRNLLFSWVFRGKVEPDMEQEYYALQSRQCGSREQEEFDVLAFLKTLSPNQ